MGTPTLLRLALCLVAILPLLAERRNIDDFGTERRNGGACCHLSELSQSPPGFTDEQCTYQTRQCLGGCPQSSNYTGGVTIEVPASSADGSSTTEQVCPKRMAQDERVCCRSTQIQKRSVWCPQNDPSANTRVQYIYDYPTDCSCGPCTDEVQTSNCYKLIRTQQFFPAGKWYYCKTSAPVEVPYCFGRCRSSDEDTRVVVNNGQYSTRIGGKDCNCCRATEYEQTEIFTVTCYKQFFDHQIGQEYQTTLSKIKDCGCRNCIRTIYAELQEDLEVSPRSDQNVVFPEGVVSQ